MKYSKTIIEFVRTRKEARRFRNFIIESQDPQLLSPKVIDHGKDSLKRWAVQYTLISEIDLSNTILNAKIKSCTVIKNCFNAFVDNNIIQHSKLTTVQYKKKRLYNV